MKLAILIDTDKKDLYTIGAKGKFNVFEIIMKEMKGNNNYKYYNIENFDNLSMTVTIPVDALG